ncbi:hypothetical protein BD324DRAFT_610682 [Kockovaella imperatae]|uniref:Uncharacterized protein n=1 Tax=Kockovaella imperatae TaxID=4999 RepID=A0A1Y1U5N9_9TREE|nr:hypothetical protein BD324DRAFT_610682 [Kockovaella imperatae]ORX33351.1 hypothetical protein BD324DRAFT_610682 [Kockovaella imperatae]
MSDMYEDDSFVREINRLNASGQESSPVADESRVDEDASADRSSGMEVDSDRDDDRSGIRDVNHRSRSDAGRSTEGGHPRTSNSTLESMDGPLSIDDSQASDRQPEPNCRLRAFTCAHDEFLRELGWEYTARHGWHHAQLRCLTFRPKVTYFETVYVSRQEGNHFLLLPVCESCKQSNPQHVKGMTCHFSRQANSCRISVFLVGWKIGGAHIPHDPATSIDWDKEKEADLKQRASNTRSRIYRLLRTTATQRMGSRRRNEDGTLAVQASVDLAPAINLRQMAKTLYEWDIPLALRKQKQLLDTSMEMPRHGSGHFDNDVLDFGQNDSDAIGFVDFGQDPGADNFAMDYTHDPTSPSPSGRDASTPRGILQQSPPAVEDEEVSSEARSSSESSSQRPSPIPRLPPRWTSPGPDTQTLIDSLLVSRLRERETRLLEYVDALEEHPSRKAIRRLERDNDSLKRIVESQHEDRMDQDCQRIHQTNILRIMEKKLQTQEKRYEEVASSASHFKDLALSYEEKRRDEQGEAELVEYRVRELEAETKCLTRKLAARKSKIEEIEGRLADSHSLHAMVQLDCKTLSMEKDMMRTTSKSLQNDLNRAQTVSEQRLEEIGHLERVLHHRSLLVRKRDAYILELERSDIVNQKRTIEELESAMSSKEDEIVSLRSQLKRSQQEVEEERKNLGTSRRIVDEKLWRDYKGQQDLQSMLTVAYKEIHRSHKRRRQDLEDDALLAELLEKRKARHIAAEVEGFPENDENEACG